MGSLGDIPDSEYIGPGENILVHVSKIGGYKTNINGKPTKPYFTVFMRDREDLKIRDRMFLTQPAMFRLKMFASAQGWDVHTIPNPCEGDPQAFPFHNFEIDTEFYIDVSADGKFTNVDDYRATNPKAPKRAWPGSRVTEPQPPAPQAEPAPSANDDRDDDEAANDDLPF